MNSTVSRRVFVGSVAAGLPLVGHASVQSFARSSTGHTHIPPASAGASDAMLEHTAGRLAAIINRIPRGGATAEDVRLAAAHIGTLAVYARQAGIDARIRTAMRELIQSKGRDAVLDVDVDRNAVRTHMKRYAVEVDERWFDLPRPDHQTRTQVMDDLRTLGITGMFQRLSSNFERIATELDRRGNLAGIRRVQAGDDWQALFCAQFLRDISVMAAHAAMTCAAAIYMSPSDATCAMAEMMLIMYVGIYLTMCA